MKMTTINSPLCTGVALAAVLFAAHSTSGQQFFVSPNGNDQWAGTLAVANADRTNGPLATLNGARDRIRQWKTSSANLTPITVTIADGIYGMTEPWLLEAEDSGTANQPITYQSAEGAHPLFRGGRQIRGFKVDEDGVWSVRMGDVQSGSWYFEQLFVNGQRAVRRVSPIKAIMK